MIDLPAWDGSLEGAESIRRWLQSIKTPRQAARTTEDRVVAELLRAVRGKKLQPNKLPPKCGSLLGPFIGMEGIEWPHDRVATIGEDEAVLWLELVHDALPDASLEAFIIEMAHARARPVWCAAVRAAAALAPRSPTFAQAIHDIGTSLSLGAKAMPANALLPNDVHGWRHAWVLLAEAHVHGLDTVRFSPQALLSATLPADASDASALMLAVGALLRSTEHKPAALETLRRWTAQLTAPAAREDALHHESLRTMVSADAGNDHSFTWSFLLEPRFLSFGRRGIGLVPSWIQSIRVAQSCGIDVAGRCGQPDLDRLIRLALDEEMDALPVFLERAPLMQPQILGTTRDAMLPVAIGELLVATQHPSIGAFDWQLLLQRAGLSGFGFSGPAGRMGPATVVVSLATSGVLLEQALRGLELSEAETLQLAGVQNGMVATQVARQSERLLRHAANRDEQVLFLWRLLVADPPRRVFDELLKMLRGRGTPLHDVVATLAALDDVRGGGTAGPELLVRHRTLAAAVDRYFGGGHHAVGALAMALETLAAPSPGAETGVSEHLRWTEHTLVPRLEEVLWGGAGGVVAWRSWLGLPTTGVREAFKHLREVLVGVREDVSAADLVATDAARIEEAAQRLHEALLPAAWPDDALIDQCLAPLAELAVTVRREVEAASRASHRLTHVIDAGDEDAAVALLDDDDLTHLPPSGVRSLAAFLLAQLRVREVQVLRARCGERVSLSSPFSQFAPLAAGMVVGGFALSERWSELTKRGAPFLGWVTLLAMLGTVVILAAHYVPRFTFKKGMSGAARLGKSLRAIAPVFTGSFLLAGATAMSALLLFGAEPVTLVGWLEYSSVGLFVGSFLGLVLQGRV